MTKGGSGKHNMLGRLIFGEKRKQHASQSRHRSSTRNGGNVADVSPSRGGATNKNPINVHDWAVWRMHLNEQMENGMSEQTDLKQLKQFLHSNPFYQQHSRDPSNGRYNGVRLLFSIPHAKLKSEQKDGSRGVPNKSSNMGVGDATTFDQNNAHPNIDDWTATVFNSVAAGPPPMVMDKTISQLLPKNLIGNTGSFLHINDQMAAADAARIRCSMRASYTASDRVHSTLQKAVKDGNVLEKIKAFEMQAAAAQAESTPKLVGGVSNIINNRMQTVTSSIQSTAQRALSPAMVQSIQHPISPMPIQQELQQQQQQQYIRSHRGRYAHPVQHRHDGHLGPIIGRESRKGAHVLEPARGDIILRRRTPSQKPGNDEDYSITAITSLALTPSQGHHHRQHHHHRASVSRSRHRQETVPDKRSSSQHDNVHKKHQQKRKQKQKETTTSSSNKTSTRRRWLKGRKETPTETATENSKQDVSANEPSKKNKNKKKNTEKEKLESTKKATSPEPKGKTSDNNRVYGVPNTTVNEQTKTEANSPPPPTPRIDEENESDREEEEKKNTETETNHTSPKEEEITQHKECDTITTTNVERRPSKTQYHQKLSSNDGEVISKIDEDTRFSRPTDDHAHRSDLNDDEDDECKSEGDVFIDESSVTTINLQQSSNVIQRHSSQCSAEQLPSDRRWQWSKESGGLIEKNNRKKKQPITIVTHKNEEEKEEEEQVVYEIPRSEQNSTLKLKKQPSSHSITLTEINIELNNNQPISKQILNAIKNSKNNNNNNNNNTQEQTTMDEFFENGPHTNPEKTIVNITSSA